MAVRICSYMCLTLLLLLGTQLATSKSVDETFKDAHINARPLALSKRAANKASKEAEEVTTLPFTDSSEYDDTEETTPMPVITSTRRLKPRRQTSKLRTTPAPTTPAADEEDEDEATTEAAEDENEEEEEAPTVKPLITNKPKPKNPKKPKRPSTVSPMLLNRINPEDDEPASASTPTAGKPNDLEQPASNLLPPMPYNYYPPQNFGFNPPQNPAFASPWGFNPLPASSSAPYDYPYPSGPAFSDSKMGTGTGSTAFAGGFASASASANGLGGTISTSSSLPGGGVQHSSSATSFSGPGGSGGSQHSSGSFIGSRGSFPAEGDDESVSIEVNGPAPAGVPAYSSSAAGPGYAISGPSSPPGPGYAVTGPGYSASGASSFGGGPQISPFANTIPTYGAYGSPVDFQNFFQQYFAAMQAQQLAFQQQLQSQIQAQQQAGGTFSSGGAFITNDQGAVDPNAQVYVNTHSSPNFASSSTSVNSRFGYGGSKSSVQAFPFSNKNDANRIWDQSNRVDSNLAGGSAGGSPSSGPQSAHAGISLGPTGGFQTAQISPASPGIFSRFGESVPPPSGNSFGVFSSSSSSSSTGPDGKQINHKSATVGVNDNGKISVKTVHDP